MQEILKLPLLTLLVGLAPDPTFLSARFTCLMLFTNLYFLLLCNAFVICMSMTECSICWLLVSVFVPLQYIDYM